MRNPIVNGNGLINKALMTLVLVFAAVFCVHAQTGNAPKVTRFYPGINESSPAEVRVNTSLYIYFDSKVTECNAQVIQDGNVIGSITYAGTAANTALPVKKDMLLAILNGGVLQPGTFVVKPVDVTYADAEGNLVKYEDTAGEWPSVTYNYSGEAGKVVSETEFLFNTIKSWYPADANEGIKTITFNKALRSGFSASLEYGTGESGNNSAVLPVPCTLSEDGMTITIDLRGRLRNVDTMVPNARFLDENGNPTDPPTTIALSVSNLYAVDGSPIIGVGKDLGATTNIELTGRLHYSYRYSDLTFSTPRITSAKFEDGNLVMTLTDNGALVSADVVFVGENGNIGAVTGVVFSGSTVSVAVPADLNTNNVLSISLENAVYSADDGVNHVIRSYVFKAGVSAIDVSMLSDIKALANADKFAISVDDVKVTYYNPEAGYIFIEDESGALQVDPTSGFAPAEGSILSGKIEGTYLGDGLISVNMANSEYTADPGDVSPMELTLGEITFPVNNFRLATIVIDGVNVEYSALDNTYLLSMENLEVPVMVYLDMIDDASFVAPTSLSEVTGIVYSSPYVEGYMIVVRHSDDIKGDTSGIESIAVDGNALSPVYSVNGVKVRDAGESLEGLPAGLYITDGKKVIVK